VYTPVLVDLGTGQLMLLHRRRIDVRVEYIKLKSGEIRQVTIVKFDREEDDVEPECGHPSPAITLKALAALLEEAA
jgi:hypothetical protein